MRSTNRFGTVRSRFACLAVTALLLVALPGVGQPALPAASADLLPPGLSALAAGATSQTEFTFDRSMLDYADKYIDNAPPEVKRAAAGIESITVHNYRFAEGATHHDSAMATIEGAYKAGGWKHLVNKNARADRADLITDVWLRFNGADINHVSVLVRGERDINFISIACWLRPLDLLHLSGHFGIPKMDPKAVMVPAPDTR